MIGPARWLEYAARRPAEDSRRAGGVCRRARPADRRGRARGLGRAGARRRRAAPAGEFAGVVTGPVSKAGLARIGYPFPGQTEFFAARWGGEPTMAFCGGRLRVALLSWHVPLREVPAGPHRRRLRARRARGGRAGPGRGRGGAAHRGVRPQSARRRGRPARRRGAAHHQSDARRAAARRTRASRSASRPTRCLRASCAASSTW